MEMQKMKALKSLIELMHKLPIDGMKEEEASSSSIDDEGMAENPKVEKLEVVSMKPGDSSEEEGEMDMEKPEHDHKGFECGPDCPVREYYKMMDEKDRSKMSEME